jgi:5'-nucleotidase/UDP-sugar diphosphatase
LGGVARRASIIDQQRELGGFVLVLDAGNGLMGDQDPAKRTLGQASIEAMNMMGYDAAALGPNDLALGENALRQRIDEAQFPILSANAAISAEDELLTTPYVLRQFGGHTIAVIGLSGGDGTQEITVRDPLEAARRTVAEVGRQADVIILLSSAGQEKNIQIAESVPEIDLIISAATSELTGPWQADKTGTLVLLADHSSPGHAGRRIGVAHLGFDTEGRLVGQEWQRLSLGPEVPADPAMAKWVGEQTTP